MLFTSAILAVAAIFQFASGHAADETLDARAASQYYSELAVRSLVSCQDKLLKNHELHDNRLAKREAWINEHVERHGIERRSVARQSLALEERQVDCILTPVVTIGPYYLDSM